MKRRLAIVLLISILCGGGLYFYLHEKPTRPDKPADHTTFVAQPPTLPRLPDRLEFTTQVKPIFSRNCQSCHSKKRSRGGLRLDQRPENWIHGDIALVVPGESDSSRLIHRLASHKSPNADRHHRLGKQDLNMLRRWIDEGAYWPTPQPRVVADWGPAERDHWAYQPLRNPQQPMVHGASWVRNPIDAFILAKLEAAGLAPVESAKPRDLIRRLTLAVSGLPPTLDRIKRFHAADDSGADQLVDELLGSSAYGEHWARYWLDLVRYADTNGYEDDNPKPLAWRYRDFVIRSFNADRRYDEFVRMQIAGDLFAKPADEDFIAAGYLRLGPWDSEPESELQQRFDQADEIVSTTSLAFLGLTAGCARCHDHPEEPVTSYDYYRLVAIFHGLHRPTKGRLEQTAPSGTPQQLTTAAGIRQQQQELRRQALQESDEETAKLLRQQASAMDADASFDDAYRLVETEISNLPTRLLLRGNPQRPGEFVSAGVPSVLTNEQWDEMQPPSRLRFANWLTRDKQALTARLIVNRIWSWHFGRGLSETPSNFGVTGATPSHRELLEWLAHWFVHEANWSLKKLHRLILTSNTYRTRCETTADARRLRELFGVFPRQRLRAEVIHDSLLAVSGRLSPEMFGRPYYPKLPAGVLETLQDRKSWNETSSAERRAVYAVVKRNLPIPMLQAFNFPTATSSCSQRVSNLTTRQALTLWNGPFTRDCARAFAKRIITESPSNQKAQIEHAFELAVARKPDAQELQAFQRFLGNGRPVTTGRPKDFESFCDLCLVIFNLNEFVFSN